MIKKLFFLSFYFLVLSLINVNAQIIFSENFEGGVMPTSWTVQTKATDGGWKIGNYTTLSSSSFTITTHTKFACTNDDKCQCDKSNDMLVTPAIDLSSYTDTKIQLSFDNYFWGGYYTDGSGYKETGFVKVSIDNGISWSTVCSIAANGDWFNQIADLSEFAGQSSVKVAIVYSDGGGGKNKNLFGLAVDNIKIYVPSEYNASIVSVKVPECFRMQGDKNITGKLLNRSGWILDSLNLNYQIDNDPVVTEFRKDLNISSTNYYNYSFTTPWTPTLGNHVVKVWASNLNGNTDQEMSNDTVYFNTVVFKAGKPVLVEYFTSASCYYCGVYDPDMEKLIAQDNDFAMGIAYHTTYNGSPDPMYNSNNASDFSNRASYYKITGYPTAFADGALCPGLLYYKSELELGKRTLKDTLVEIKNPAALLSGNKLTFSADVVADKQITGSYKAHMVVIEQEIDFVTAPGTNGGKEFPWVMRKMIPNANGTVLPATMNIGDKQTVSGSWTVDASIYHRDQIRVIFFVQNVTTKEVLWATMLAPTVGIHEINIINIAGIFPNPVIKEANVYFSLSKAANTIIQLRNMLGELVSSKDLGLLNVGKNNYTLNVENVEAGMYFVEINTGKDIATRKITIVK